MKTTKRIPGLREVVEAAIVVAPEVEVTSEVAAEETIKKAVEVATPIVEATEEAVAAKEEAIVISPEVANLREAAETMIITTSKMRKKANGKITWARTFLHKQSGRLRLRSSKM